MAKKAGKKGKKHHGGSKKGGSESTKTSDQSKKSEKLRKHHAKKPKKAGGKKGKHHGNIHGELKGKSHEEILIQDVEPAEPRTDSEVGGKPDSEVGGKPDSEVGAKTESEVGGKPDSEVGGKPDSEVAAKPESEVRAKSEFSASASKLKAAKSGEDQREKMKSTSKLHQGEVTRSKTTMGSRAEVRAAKSTSMSRTKFKRSTSYVTGDESDISWESGSSEDDEEMRQRLMEDMMKRKQTRKRRKTSKEKKKGKKAKKEPKSKEETEEKEAKKKGKKGKKGKKEKGSKEPSVKEQVPVMPQEVDVMEEINRMKALAEAQATGQDLDVESTVTPSIKSKGKDKKKKKKKKGRKKKLSKKERAKLAVEQAERLRIEAEAEAIRLAEEARIRAEEERKAAIEKEKRDIVEHQWRLEQMEAGRELSNALMGYNLRLRDEEKERHEWDLYVNCDRLPDASKCDRMNTFLHLWEQTMDDTDMTEAARRTGDVLKLMEDLDELIDNCEDCEEETENWKWIRDLFRQHQKQSVDVATYRLLRDIERKLHRIDIPTADFQHADENLVMCLWLKVQLPVPLPNPRRPVRPRIEIDFAQMKMDVHFPQNVEPDKKTIRALYTRYDHLSDTCETYAAPPVPPTHHIDLFEYVKQEWREKMLYKWNNRVRPPPPPPKEPEDQSEGEQVVVEVEEEPVPGPDEEIPLVPYRKLTPSASDYVIEKEDALYREIRESMAKQTFEEDPSLINLRQYAILGGVYALDLLKQPPQPQAFVTLDLELTPLQLPKELEYVEYASEYVEPQPEAEESGEEGGDVGGARGMSTTGVRGASATKMRGASATGLKGASTTGLKGASTTGLKGASATAVRNASANKMRGASAAALKGASTIAVGGEEGGAKAVSTTAVTRGVSMGGVKGQSTSRVGDDGEGVARTVSMSGGGTRSVTAVGARRSTTGRRITPEEIDEELKRLEEALDKLILVNLVWPEHVIFLELPIVCQWDPVNCHWTRGDIHDVKHNEEKCQLSFRTTRFGQFALATLKYVNLPYQAWELKPEADENVLRTIESGTVTLQITAAILLLEFNVNSEGLVALASLQNSPNMALQEDVVGKYFKLNKLMRLMQSAGVDVFPALDALLYVTPATACCEKHWPTERHTYLCMAQSAHCYNYAWSRWNVTTGDRRAIVMQLREYDTKATGVATGVGGVVKPAKVIRAHHQMALVTPLRALLVDCTEVSQSFSEEPLENMKFYSDLIHLVKGTSSMAMKNRLTQDVEKQLVYALYELLIATRVFSFS